MKAAIDVEQRAAVAAGRTATAAEASVLRTTPGVLARAGSRLTALGSRALPSSLGVEASVGGAMTLAGLAYANKLIWYDMLYVDAYGGYEALGEKEWTGEVTERTGRGLASAYEVSNLDTHNVKGKNGEVSRVGDLKRAADMMESWTRGASKLARETAATLRLDLQSFHKDDVDASVAVPGIKAKVTYGQEVLRRLQEFAAKPETPTYEKAEANAAIAVLAPTLTLAAAEVSAYESNVPYYATMENRPEFKALIEAGKKAQLVAIRTSSIALITQGEKQLGTLTDIDPAKRASFEKTFAELKQQMSLDLTQDQLKPLQAQVMEVTKNLNKAALAETREMKEPDIAEAVKKFLYGKFASPDPLLYRTAFGIGLMQHKAGMKFNEFNDAMVAAFPGEVINADSIRTLAQGYTMTPDAKVGDKVGGYVWDPEAKALLVAYAMQARALAKTHDNIHA